MSRNRTISVISVVVVCGAVSFISTRLATTASYKTEAAGALPWLANTDSSVINLEKKFNKEADGLIDNLLREQKRLAVAIEDPCTPDKSILDRAENVITAHEHLLRRVGEHVALLRSKLPAAQRQRLMSLCADVVRGPMVQGRGQGYGYGAQRRMGWQDSSGSGQGPRGRGYGRQGGGRGFRQRRRQRGRLAQCLQLTDEQIQIAQKEDPNYDSDLARLRDELLAERTKLLEMFENPQTSNEELLAQIDRLILAHNRIERRTVPYLLILRPHLSPEQQKWLMGLCQYNPGY